MRAINAERLRSRRAKLEAELRALREQEEQQDERRYALVGRVVLAHAEHDPAFRDGLMAVLDRALTKKRERRLFDLPAAPRRSAARGAEPAPAEPGRAPEMAPGASSP